MAQLEGPHLLHPEAELLVRVLESVVQLLLLRRILEDEILPGLAVCPGHGPAAGLEYPVDVFVGDRIGLDAAYAHPRVHDAQQHVVVGLGHGGNLRDEPPRLTIKQNRRRTNPAPVSCPTDACYQGYSRRLNWIESMWSRDTYSRRSFTFLLTM